jgi:hypothetical protein
VRLRRFSLSGYKNLTQPVVLDGLGPINLIHGANNVGKSNLLQAMEVFFRSLPAASDLPSSQGREVLSLGIDLFGAGSRSLFNLERPAPILLRGVLDVPLEELAAVGIQDSAGTEIDVKMRLSWDASSGGRSSRSTVSGLPMAGTSHRKDRTTTRRARCSSPSSARTSWWSVKVQPSASRSSVSIAASKRP